MPKSTRKKKGSNSLIIPSDHFVDAEKWLKLLDEHKDLSIGYDLLMNSRISFNEQEKSLTVYIIPEFKVFLTPLIQESLEKHLKKLFAYDRIHFYFEELSNTPKMLLHERANKEQEIVRKEMLQSPLALFLLSLPKAKLLDS